MPKISDAKREARRGEIIDAAVRCFTRSGYQRTSMADIIAESGLSAGAIYSYFTSKQELVRAVAGRVLEGRRTELDMAGSQHPLSPAELVATLVDGVRREAPVGALVQVWAEATVDPELADLFREVRGRLHDATRTHLERWAQAHRSELPLPPEEWAAAVAPVLISLIPGFTLQTALVEGFDQTAFVRAIPLVLPGAATR